MEEATPDLHDAPEIFRVLRAAGFAASLKGEYDNHRQLLKPEVIWNIETGLALDAGAIGRAEKGRGQLYHRMLAFMKRYDLLLVPAAILPPFDVKTRWIKSLDGETFDNYVEWIRITYALTLTSLPVSAFPAA